MNNQRSQSGRTGFLLFTLSLAPLAGQTSIPIAPVLQPQATAGRVLHIYVDPEYGNDREARRALELLFARAEPFNNAPIPFKTLNGHGRTGLVPRRDLGAIPTLAVNSTAFDADGFTHCIVHALPGLYGPAGEAACYGPNAQRWNDEVFPIVMLDRVSVQGAGMLETVVDMRGDQVETDANRGSAFLFTGPRSATSTTIGLQFSTFDYFGNPQDLTEQWNQVVERFECTFIDGLTIRGSTRERDDSIFPLPLSSPAAGICISGEHHVLEPTVSNCALTDNCAGVIQWTRRFWRPTEEGFTHPESTFQNNSFVRNRVGFIDTDDAFRWGQEPPPFRSRSRFLNNLFVNDWWDLVGVDGELLRFSQVWQSGVMVPFTQNGGYVNAFSTDRVFPNAGATAHDPAIDPPHGNCWVSDNSIRSFALPGRTLPALGATNRLEMIPWSPYTGAPTNPPRAQLFVYQRLLDYAAPVVTLADVRTQHDVRVVPFAPHAVPNAFISANLATSYAGMFENPLYNQGVGPANGPFVFRFYNGTAYVDSPLYQARRHVLDVRDTATIPGQTIVTQGSGYDNDSEGFGNPREVAPYAAFGLNPTAVGTADIGADEIDLLILGGYEALSRRYSHVVEAAPAQYAFGVPNQYGLIDGGGSIPAWGAEFGIVNNPFTVEDMFHPYCGSTVLPVAFPPYRGDVGGSTFPLNSPIMPSLLPELTLAQPFVPSFNPSVDSLNTTSWHIEPPLPANPSFFHQPRNAANQVNPGAPYSFDARGGWRFTGALGFGTSMARETCTLIGAGVYLNWQSSSTFRR